MGKVRTVECVTYFLNGRLKIRIINLNFFKTNFVYLNTVPLLSVHKIKQVELRNWLHLNIWERVSRVIQRIIYKILFNSVVSPTQIASQKNTKYFWDSSFYVMFKHKLGWVIFSPKILNTLLYFVIGTISTAILFY